MNAPVYPFRRYVVRRRVVINLLSGRAVEGVVVAQDGPLLIVKDARIHETGSHPSEVDGDVVVERGQVDFIQALAGR